MIKPGTICYLRAMPGGVRALNGRVVEVVEWVGWKRGYVIRAAWMPLLLAQYGMDPTSRMTCPGHHLLPIDGTGPDKDVKIKLPLWMVD